MAETAEKTAPAGGSRLVFGVVMLLVALASLLLLVYVGYAEGRRTYQNLVVDKMAAQGELVQTPLNTFLRAGLPLRQFPGFSQIGKRVLSSDDTITAITVIGNDGKPVFREASGKEKAETALTVPPQNKRFTVLNKADFIHVLLPLQDRFETVGAVVVTTRRATVDTAALERFIPVGWIALGLALLFALAAMLARNRLETSRFPWLYVGFGAAFAGVAAAVVLTLVSFYAQGVQSKAQALAESLRQRLAPVAQYKLDLNDLDGLRATFLQYRRLNSDIQAIALMQGEKVRIHTDPAREGAGWSPGKDTYEFASSIGTANMRIAVALPTSVVWRAVAKNIKNFIALFIATALFAGVFLRVGRLVGGSRKSLPDGEATAASPADASVESPRAAAAIEVLKPIFFLAVFFEHLPTSFLPQTLRDAAAAGGFGTGAASWAFAAYFLCFLLVLVPATKMADRHGPRGLLWSGALLAAAGSAILALSDWFPALAAARGLSGLGQGMLLIGAQTYIVTHAPPNMRARAAAVIVFGFNGGMIAGTAIGSLLVNYIAGQGVFLLGAATGVLVALFAMVMMPRVKAETTVGGAPAAGFLRMTGKALGNFEFLRVMLLIGLPSKAVLTGIVVFAMPLVFHGMGYPPEDIGQLVMIYPCGVLLASGWISRRIDRIGGAKQALTIGALIAGGGMLIVGVTGWPGAPDLFKSGTMEPVVIGVGVFLLGLAHGFINAPVISYVASTELAQEMGANQVSSLYRVLERVGHVAGPALAGQLLLMTGGGAAAIGWAGAIMVGLGILFLLTGIGRRQAAPAG